MHACNSRLGFKVSISTTPDFDVDLCPLNLTNLVFSIILMYVQRLFSIAAILISLPGSPIPTPDTVALTFYRNVIRTAQRANLNLCFRRTCGGSLLVMTADSWVSDQFSFEECTLSKHEDSFTGGQQSQDHAFHFLFHH